MSDIKINVTCSFCGDRSNDFDKLFISTFEATICEDCVAISVAEIDKQKAINNKGK